MWSYIIALSLTDILPVFAIRSWSLILLMSWPAILVAVILSASDILSNIAAFSSFDILSMAILSLSDILDIGILESPLDCATTGAAHRPRISPADAKII